MKIIKQHNTILYWHRPLQRLPNSISKRKETKWNINALVSRKVPPLSLAPKDLDFPS